MENLTGAMEFIRSLGVQAEEIKPVVIGGKTYVRNIPLKKIDMIDKAKALEVSNLTSLVDYIQDRSEELMPAMIIHIVSPTEVELISGLNFERDRETLIISNCNPFGFKFDTWYNQEEFIINLQTAFQETEDLKLILKVAGNVESNSTANYGDDGCTQMTTIKKGIASKENVLVPNPVTLKPYRTFLEVDQPESKFVFRISERDGAPMFKIVAADGGLWKYQAVKNIKNYLQENIDAEEKNIAIIG